MEAELWPQIWPACAAWVLFCPTLLMLPHAAADALTISTAIAALAKVFVIIDPYVLPHGTESRGVRRMMNQRTRDALAAKRSRGLR